MSLNVEVLEQSFERVKPNADEFASRFYNYLLIDSPQLRPLFAKTNMEDQKQKLMMSLVLVIENLRNPNYLKIILKNLGERHVGYGAIQEHYPLVGAALLKTFESYLGKDWTPVVQQAWIDAYEVLAQLMLEGAKNVQGSSPTRNVVQPSVKPAIKVEVPIQPPTNVSSLDETENAAQLEHRSKQISVNSFNRSETEKHLQVKYEVQPSNNSSVMEKSSTQSTTSSLNLKLLVIISIVASLFGIGLLYYHFNSKQDNGSLTSSILPKQLSL